MKRNVTIGAAAVVVAVFGSACSKSDSSEKSFDFAAVAPIVKSATPEGLKPSSSAATVAKGDLLSQLVGLFSIPYAMATSDAPYSDVKSSLEAMFKGTFGKISGGNGVGYINSNLEDLDSRVTELEERFTELPTCFSNELKDLSVDFVNHTDMHLDLKVQCRDVFATSSDNKAAPGSGMVFGRREKTESQSELVSLMLLLKHKTSASEGGSNDYDAGFGYAGTIEAAGTEDEAVEMLFGQFNTKSSLETSDEDHPMMARIYAKPKTKAFELVMAGTSPSVGGPISGGSTQLGCGFRMISDGSLIVVKGNYKSFGDCSGDLSSVNLCVDATTLADVSSTSSEACATLAATQFHIASSSTSLDSMTAAVLTSDTATASSRIFSALKPNGTDVSAKTSSVQ